MRALGKGSVASILKVGLHVAGVVLWIGLIAVCIGGFAYLAALALRATGAIQIDLATEHDWESLAWLIAGPALIVAGFWFSCALIIVRRLRRLFESFTSGEPFKKENADHLRAIWVTMVAMELAKIVFAVVALSILAAHGIPSEMAAEADVKFEGLDLSPWISILVLIVLSEVFREGARLREEQDLTV